MTAALIGLLPVLLFLGALVLLDSYKLVKLRLVVATVAAGMAAAGAVYLFNEALFGRADIDFTRYSRYASPVVEEVLKALVIAVLIRSNRIGFLVDGAILGFAAGTGFALVENVQYIRLIPDAGVGTWLVRGLGTAIMHGGATAIFAVMGIAMMEARGAMQRWPVLRFAPGLVIAIVLHSVYNHFFLSPLASTIGVVIALPLLLGAVFTRSEAAVGDWLGKGFDADAEMLDLLDSEGFADSPVGRYLHALKDRFQGPVVADLLCYLRLYTELAIRAKGVLLMRESGFQTTIDAATREKFAELRYLEGSIGRTGLLAIQPMLHMSHKDLWQLYMIDG